MTNVSGSNLTSGSSATAALRAGISRAGDRHFSEILNARDAKLDRLPQSVDDLARRNAEAFVALTLVQPILAAARQDPFRTELFHGGSGEEAFGAQLDQVLAERITQRANFPVVDVVYRQVMRAGKKGQGPEAKGQATSDKGQGTSRLDLHG